MAVERRDKNQDAVFRAAIANSRHMMVPYFLMASYLYYQEYVSLLSDAVYDRLCQDLDAEWDEIEHQHKHVIDRQLLKAGSAYSTPREAYPPLVLMCAFHLADIPHKPLTLAAQHLYQPPQKPAQVTQTKGRITFTKRAPPAPPEAPPPPPPKKKFLSFGRKKT